MSSVIIGTLGMEDTNSNKTASHQYSRNRGLCCDPYSRVLFRLHFKRHGKCLFTQPKDIFIRWFKAVPYVTVKWPIPLIASDLTGTFIGKGVSGLSYIPNNIGRDTVFYIVPDAFCPDTTSVIVDVLLSPSPNLGL